MGSQVDKIKEEINKQTSSELELIEKEINEKIKDIEEATEKEIEKIVSSIEESGKSNAENQAKRELGKVRLEAKMKYLSEKEKGVNDVFSEGKEKLKALTQTPEYSNILSELIISAGVSLGGGNLTVNLLKSDVSKVNLNELAKKIASKTGNETTLISGEKEPETKYGGVMILKQYDDDTHVWVDNTFEAIIERRRDNIRSEVSKILFS
jgi:vacuolar-type H+-ATPase subunit E/Vma4